jgi:hypothetical protein
MTVASRLAKLERRPGGDQAGLEGTWRVAMASAEDGRHVDACIVWRLHWDRKKRRFVADRQRFLLDEEAGQAVAWALARGQSFNIVRGVSLNDL